MSLYAAGACAAGLGGVLTWRLAAYAAGPLPSGGRLSGIARASVAALAAGIAAALAIPMAKAPHGHVWEVPALVCWSAALLTAAAYDGATRRVPTALTRQATVATLVLLATAGVLEQNAKTFLVASAISALAGVVTLGVRRTSHLGLGDVRLAALGGLGLGNVTDLGAAAGICAFAFVGVLTATRRRSPAFPLGPALAAGFLTAAIL